MPPLPRAVARDLSLKGRGAPCLCLTLETSDMTLQVYTLFHLNLAFSSIEEEMRGTVIERCYWPLLKLARDDGFPLAIEATAYTLDAIAKIDPVWIDTL